MRDYDYLVADIKPRSFEEREAQEYVENHIDICERETFEDFLMHYGTPRHSGRYPWGSGKNPYQRYADFYSQYSRLKAQGLSDKDIAAELGCVDKFGKPSTGILRRKWSNATAEKRAADIETAMRYKEDGLSNVEIGRKMGINESTVRSLLDEKRAQRTMINAETAAVIRDYVDKYKYIDIGPGLDIALNVSSTRIDNAIDILEQEGYKKQYIQLDQMGTNYKTTFTVLTPGDVSYSDLMAHKYDIKIPYLENKVVDNSGEVTRLGILKPVSIDSSRIDIVYGDKGGKEKDGLIELRPGVKDISLNGSMYAQVRIAVDDHLYLKGMAVYNPDLPPGIDIRFNTNKESGTPFEKVLKPMKGVEENGKVDWDNPFGASISQKEYEEGGVKKLSAINYVHDQGEWMTWDRNLASQFLSKQPLKMAERQLELSYSDKLKEFEEIKNLTNNTVKKELLISFADKCDSLAVDLKAAPFANQTTNVLIPVPELKQNEVYAPNYADGTRLALVRYPHGGIFEIPEVVVRNTGSPAAKIIPNAPDAIAINSKVAERLSGADFDGDYVITIPYSDKVRVRTSPPLEGLKNFDPKDRYPYYKGMHVMTEQEKGIEMGKVTNLITDMTFQGATPDQLARAVRHSMVVIDANKHKLNYKQSAIDNNIEELKKIYQDDGKGHTGAATIISRAGAEYDVPLRKDWRPSSKTIGPNGEKIPQYKTKNNTYEEGTLNGVLLKNGDRVRLRTDKNTGEEYYIKTNEVTGKRERVKVTDMDIQNRDKGKVIVNTDKKTGEKYYIHRNEDGSKERVYVSDSDFTKRGVVTRNRLQSSTKMAEYPDAFALTSGGSKENPGFPMEKVYAQFANDMKGLANAAEKRVAIYTKSEVQQRS